MKHPASHNQKRLCKLGLIALLNLSIVASAQQLPSFDTPGNTVPGQQQVALLLNRIPDLNEVPAAASAFRELISTGVWSVTSTNYTILPSSRTTASRMLSTTLSLAAPARLEQAQNMVKNSAKTSGKPNMSIDAQVFEASRALNNAAWQLADDRSIRILGTTLSSPTAPMNALQLVVLLSFNLKLEQDKSGLPFTLRGQTYKGNVARALRSADKAGLFQLEAFKNLNLEAPLTNAQLAIVLRDVSNWLSVR